MGIRDSENFGKNQEVKKAQETPEAAAEKLAERKDALAGKYPEFAPMIGNLFEKMDKLPSGAQDNIVGSIESALVSADANSAKDFLQRAIKQLDPQNA